MKSARVIITFDCPRNCSYCCNKQPKGLESGKYIKELADIKGYDNYVITGGEPLNNPVTTLNIIKELKELNPEAKIYMYTSIWLSTPEQLEIFDLLDGITYSLHGKGTEVDKVMFNSFQDVLSFSHHYLSGRLWIDNQFAYSIEIVPSIWERIIQEEPKKEYFPLGEDGNLFILEN